MVRDGARPLVEFRDAEVLLSTLETLEKDHAKLDFAGIRRGLEERAEKVRREVLDDTSVRQTVQSCLKDALKEASQWEIAASRRQPTRELAHMHARTRDAYAAASIDPSVENLHEWRKQAKYLGNQV